MGNKNKKQHQMEALARWDAKIRQLPTILHLQLQRCAI